MTPFTIEVKACSRKFILKQDEKTQRLLREKLEKVAQDPFDKQQSKWLTGHDNLRSARVGGIRLIFEVDKTNRSLTLLIADSRGQVYNRIE